MARKVEQYTDVMAKLDQNGLLVKQVEAKFEDQ